MVDTHRLNQTGYTPVGDITVMALCLVLFVILCQTYIYKNRHFSILFSMIASMFAAAVSNIIYQTMLISELVNPGMLYVMRAVHHIAITFVPILYVVYLEKPLWIPVESNKKIMTGLIIALSAAILFDVSGTLFKFGFYVHNGVLHKGFNPYIIAYLLITIMIFYLIMKYRNRIIKQIFRGITGVNAVSVALMVLQGMHHQNSFTSVAYFFLILGIVFMFHTNPYDVDTGAVTDSFFMHEIKESLDKKKKLVVISCRMVNFSRMIKESKELKYELYAFFRHNLKHGILYRFPDDRLVFTVPSQEENSGEENIIDKMVTDFRELHGIFNMDYKIVMIETDPRIDMDTDYIRIVEYIEQSMPANTIHTVTERDIEGFFNSRYILSEIEDIVKCQDLDDPRVLAYCQPVFNMSTRTFDTAEALMRLKLDKCGMVYPDKFIPLAEQNGLIHMLSLIILNKTCRSIKELMDEGYIIQRISVNFSAIDMRYENFCGEVKDIILSYQIPFSKIAVEITESRNENDFNLMKQRVDELREMGIKFYLDDFGTGYSNFDRIMEIPFDIIKFDRSLLIEYGKSDSSEFMVYTFARMFSKLNYSVLFEGVEDEKDERNCVKMNANYLQGYKYSKPIPMENLRDFLELSKGA